MVDQASQVLPIVTQLKHTIDVMAEEQVKKTDMEKLLDILQRQRAVRARMKNVEGIESGAWTDRL